MVMEAVAAVVGVAVVAAAAATEKLGVVKVPCLR